MATVLLVESARANGSSFAPHLKKHYQVLLANTGKEAMAMVRRQKPDVMVVDARLMRTSGERICALLRGQVEAAPILHILENPPLNPVLADTSANNIWVSPPISHRKLSNCIKHHITPSNPAKLLNAGPLTLNTDLDLLISPQGEQKLTPKVAQLLGIFIRNMGQLVDRRLLIKEVWQTDYMGDTRTLDVHIRWLRQAIEPKPNSPQVLKTVRGKGYIFQPIG